MPPIPLSLPWFGLSTVIIVIIIIIIIIIIIMIIIIIILLLLWLLLLYCHRNVLYKCILMSPVKYINIIEITEVKFLPFAFLSQCLDKTLLR